ncbi:MAG: DNA polymerase III subunit beta [Oscillospiraceae bacterium]|nr:DNA polymerase III subunit beta [Oscillospiraceae bacterium]
MKFICQQSELNEALNNVSRAVPQKSPITALTGIKVSLNRTVLELTGYDLELGIQTKIDVQSEDIGDFIIEARLFCEIVRKMPSEEISVETDDNLTVTIKGDKAEYKILAVPADEYPSIPNYDSGDSFTVSQALLKNMINQTIFAVAVTENKPILTGELFDISDYCFNLVAIDGYRLAVRTEKIDTDDRYHFVVKAKALSEVSKLLKDEDESAVTVHVSKKHITFEISGYMVISRLLEGEFHNYKGSIPTNHSTEIILNTKDLISSLERCMLLINDKNKAPVKCIFNNGQVKISCSTAMGKLSDEFDIDLTGPMVEIGFNCRYLLDALKAAESDKVRLLLNGGLSPMKILPMEGDAYTFLVLPVRLKTE